MTGNSQGSDSAVQSDRRRVLLPRIPGIIEGSMTMHPEPGGGVSFRVIIGVGSGRTAKSDLLELIISGEHIGELSRALTDQGAQGIDDCDSMPSFPCHIGFCRSAISSAA